MYDNQNQQLRVRGGNMLVDAASILGRDAEAREATAVRLSQEALRQCQRSVVGLLALPASVALGVAATVTWVTAFIERGFESFQSSVSMFEYDARAEERGFEREQSRIDEQGDRAQPRA
jgi:hypothetical protein